MAALGMIICLSQGAVIKPTQAGQGPLRSELEETFTRIFEYNLWEHPDSRSGPGSTIEATAYVREGIEQIIEDYKIKSVLDAACGDFGWFSQVNLHGASYTGMDVVPQLVESLQSQYGKKNRKRKFIVGDMTIDRLPKADLVVARDVFGHLSYQNGLKALANIRASGAKWFLSTTFIGGRHNSDIADGDWRPVNLSGYPYNLGTPTNIIIEHCMVGGGVVADKSLGLWPIDRLPLMP